MSIAGRFFIAGMLAVLLGGCDSSDEFLSASPFLNEGATRVRANLSSNDGARFHQIYFAGDDAKGIIIKEGEHFSVSLLSAYICGFRESRFSDILQGNILDESNPDKNRKDRAPATTSGCTYGGSMTSQSGERQTRGEIAIIANAGEAPNTRSHVMNPADARSKGRVIYYNQDVRESGQLINAINVPIYGPKEYGGKNFVLDLWMMELDNQENEQTKQLLTSLADIGGKAYPPSAPVLGLLNTLGGAFLSGNQDDVEARFQMRFDVPGPDESNVSRSEKGKNIKSNVWRLPLAEGYYAFVREENRDLKPEWDKLQVNKNLGELCVPEEGKQSCDDSLNTTYREGSWFLVRVARESASAALDIEYGERLRDFLGRLDIYDASDMKETKAAIYRLNKELEKVTCLKTSEKKIEADAELKETCKPYRKK